MSRNGWEECVWCRGEINEAPHANTERVAFLGDRLHARPTVRGWLSVSKISPIKYSTKVLWTKVTGRRIPAVVEGCPMHVPGLMERVRLLGVDEVYLVTRVDRKMHVADLLPIIYGKRQVDSVPFLAMESIPGCGPPLPELGDKREG